MRIIPGVRQNHAGLLYRIGFDAQGKQHEVPYVPIMKLEYTPGNLAFATDRLVRVEIDGTRVTL
jgi:hypothetical protein